jgi:hypothetical protein
LKQRTRDELLKTRDELPETWEKLCRRRILLRFRTELVMANWEPDPRFVPVDGSLYWRGRSFLIAIAERSQRVPSLDKLTNVAILGLCIVIAGDLVYRDVIRPHAAATAQAGPARPVPLKAGEAFPKLAGLKQEPGKPSLLLVVRSGCKYCTESVPFYKELVREVRASKIPVQLIGVCLESDKACADYFSQTQVAVDATIGAPNGLEKIQGTPTIVMLDPSGKVAETWVGALNPDRQKAVIAALSKRS